VLDEQAMLGIRAGHEDVGEGADIAEMQIGRRVCLGALAFKALERIADGRDGGAQ
jgi:hypothetical protein